MNCDETSGSIKQTDQSFCSCFFHRVFCDLWEEPLPQVLNDADPKPMNKDINWPPAAPGLTPNFFSPKVTSRHVTSCSKPWISCCFSSFIPGLCSVFLNLSSPQGLSVDWVCPGGGAQFKVNSTMSCYNTGGVSLVWSKCIKGVKRVPPAHHFIWDRQEVSSSTSWICGSGLTSCWLGWFFAVRHQLRTNVKHCSNLCPWRILPRWGPCQSFVSHVLLSPRVSCPHVLVLSSLLFQFYGRFNIITVFAEGVYDKIMSSMESSWINNTAGTLDGVEALAMSEVNKMWVMWLGLQRGLSPEPKSSFKNG